MTVTSKKHSVYFRGFVLVIAFALSILCFPVNGLIALAVEGDADPVYTDHTFMTIDGLADATSKVVTKGATYTIPTGYIGGVKQWAIGSSIAEGTQMSATDAGIKYVSSDVKVTYNGEVVSSADNKFVASQEGTYVVTYSYTYKNDENDYTHSYDLEVRSVLSSASVSFESGSDIVMPSVIDLSVKGVKDGENFKNLYIPLPEVLDKDGEAIEDVEYYAESAPSDTTDKKYVVLTANGGANVKHIEVKKDDKGFYIEGKNFADPSFGAGNYTVKFSYYNGSNFVTSTTKTTKVEAASDNEENNYYKGDYKLSLELASDWVDNGQTGVKSTLPVAKGVTPKGDATEEVDVAYKVEVLFNSSTSKNYAEFTAEQFARYNADEEEPVLLEEKDADGKHVRYYLAKPTEFKPLENGYYTFVYHITDFYGNVVSSAVGAYEFKDIKDEQKPTPIIYDASVTEKDGENTVPTYENADYKLASQTPANGVVIYAIGMEDNVSKVGDENVKLTRKIMTDETVVKLTIEDYSNKNLVFNYRETENKAWNNLRLNNFLIRKKTTDVSTDTGMLGWLNQNGYMIVVDNANAEHIFKIFDAEGYFANIKLGDEAITKENAVNWFKTEDAKNAGFAYINSDQTFGAKYADGGMGTGYYYIHYIAVDAEGNESDISRRMNVGIDYDEELPEIKFATTLQTAYTPNSTVKFDVPTASDTQDNYMLVKTLYRFRNVAGEVISDGDVDVAELWKDLGDKKVDGKPLTSTYKEFAGNGYFDLTDRDATSYSIELSEAPSTATELQILVYVYDDAGNARIYGQNIDIANANDQEKPELVTKISNPVEEYEQGETITLPTMEVYDDAVAYMGFNISIKLVVDQDTTIDIDPVGYYQHREILDGKGMGKYTINAGKFVASHAGTYQVSISAYDAAGNTVVSFMNYKVDPRIIIQSPQISSTLPKTQTVEKDDYVDANGEAKTLELPAPTVNYDIPKSVTYDVYSKNKELYDTVSNDEYKNTDFVVYGINENGKPLNYSTTYGTMGALDVSNMDAKEDPYDLIYTVNLLAYNFKHFEYKNMTSDGNGHYSPAGLYVKDEDVRLEASATGDKIVAYNGGKMFEITLDANKQIQVSGETFGTYFQDWETLELENWFKEVKAFSLSSEPYKITIQDKKGPKISEQPYDNAIDPEVKKVIDIYALEANDASGIDWEKSSITLTTKLANGSSPSKEWTGSEIRTNKQYNLSNEPDGTYKITYTVYDKVGNKSTKEYTIAVGDNVAPTINIPKDFVEKSYKIGNNGKPLVIDLTKVTFTDTGSGIADGTVVKVVLKNTSTGEEVEEIEESSSETSKAYNLDEVGTYTFTFTVEDKVGNEATQTVTFEVTAKSQDTTMVYKVVGTVLIVVSVLVLAGVIIYFIVSKVKLDKELKK